MADKELKRLSRSELLEMLISQSEENELLRGQVKDLQNSLNERRIYIEQAGSIAEASLLINKVFESAEAAAQDYINNIKHLSDKQGDILKRNEEENQYLCQQMIEETKEKCKIIENDALKEAERIKSDAQQEASEYWNSIYLKLNSYVSNNSELKHLLSFDFLNAKIGNNKNDTADV
ncbi:MAG: hypothetical protein J6Q89_05930 [Clostridia bacterium]|nr:hypothetical protein [Clostridia bacterium]